MRAALERVVVDAYRAVSDAQDVGGATVLRVPTAPDSPMLNRVVGLGVARPATEAGLDLALAALGDDVRAYVAVEPGARPAELGAWLAARGCTPGWGWMGFERGVEELPPVPATPRLELIEDDAAAAAFARIVRIGYELPEAVEAALAPAPFAGWRCWLAYDADEPIATSGYFAADGVAYLGMGATLPGHRGKGGQTALLAARMRDAAERGCELLLTETGERREGLPSNSYRNIVRAGFREREVTANWLREPRPAS